MVAFHITCAFKHGLLIEQMVAGDQVVFNCFCVEHSKANGGLASGKAVVTEEEGRPDENSPLKRRRGFELSLKENHATGEEEEEEEDYHVGVSFSQIF